MPAATLFAQPFETITDDDGLPVPGAKIYVYVAGTSTPQQTFHDSDLTTPWTQPIVCAANGKTTGPIFVSPMPSLKIAVTDADGVTIAPYPMDNWTPYQLES